MRHVVANVAKDTARVGGGSGIPIPEYYCMCKFPEWYRKNKEERWWHYEAQSIHWKVVMDAVEEKV